MAAIRFVFWWCEFIATPKSVFLFLPVLGLPGRFQLFLEKLHQAIDQPSLAADHVQSTLVLVLFQNPVQAALKLVHNLLLNADAPPKLRGGLRNLFLK
jgi:hypothetical protein